MPHKFEGFQDMTETETMMTMVETAVTNTITVTFSLPCGLWAGRVSLVGDFNDWDETATPMVLTNDGWVVTLELPLGRQFQYRYLIDGTTWMNDWRADHYVPNELGGHNSVIFT